MPDFIPNSRAVFAYPYEGGIYHMFGSLRRRDNTRWQGHPYYDALYGSNPEKARSEAVNLATFFDEIVLPPADEFLPDKNLYESANKYRNTDTGVIIELNYDYGQFAYETAGKLLQNQKVVNALKANASFPTKTQEVQHIVQRTLQQLQAAISTGATIVCGDDAESLIKAVVEEAGPEIGIMSQVDRGPRLLRFSEQLFPLVGLDWKCAGYDSFCEIRKSTEIRAYGAGFRNAVNSCAPENLSAELLELMRKALDNHEVSSRARSAFSTSGALATVLGIIPVVSELMSFLGMGSYLAEKRSERQSEKNSWFRLGSKMHEVSIESLLKTKDRE